MPIVSYFFLAEIYTINIRTRYFTSYTNKTFRMTDCMLKQLFMLMGNTNVIVSAQGRINSNGLVNYAHHKTTLIMDKCMGGHHSIRVKISSVNGVEDLSINSVLICSREKNPSKWLNTINLYLNELH